ncbi:SDR family oxidoreductase [Salinimicrobium sp. TIG7-5_MAKvit]|uniref:SDR family NAD(P)-dependent oxidoreductase n=1 Tax=Salinimicrobium sp. TIG7-5_MAKvit TaxID=3121289 RepID=UPI003C6DF940
MNKNLIALVTGANAGLGFATAKKFCDNGITTYVNGRNKEKTLQACEELGPNAKPFILDLNNLDEIPEAVAKLAEEAGKIDILVNNAGINMKKEFLEVTNDEFQNILHTNVLALFAVSREVAKVMKKNNYGSIIRRISAKPLDRRMALTISKFSRSRRECMPSMSSCIEYLLVLLSEAIVIS